jgi:cell division protein FtsB
MRPRRALLAFLGLLLVWLQYRLWFGDGGLAEQHRLDSKLEELREQNAELQARNQRFAHEILELREGTEAIEERARSELGLIRQGEIFYQFVDPSSRAAGQVTPGVPQREQ